MEMKLINPANRRRFNIIVVGTGLAGASASASLAEMGYNVKTFCIQDSPRRAHSIAAQGGFVAGPGTRVTEDYSGTVKVTYSQRRQRFVAALIAVFVILRMDFRTFLAAFVNVPCQILTTGRRIVYRLLAWNPWQHIFFRFVDAT